MPPAVPPPSSADNSEYENPEIAPKAVLRCFIGSIHEPNYKRFLVLDVIDGSVVGIVLFNTDARTAPKIRHLQMEVKGDGKSYLSHDSHLDCSNIIELSYRTIEEELDDGDADYLGELDDATRAQLQDLHQA